MLSASQVATFKAAILADATLVTARANGDQGAIAAYYNSAGTSKIWRPSIAIRELNTAIVWTEFTALTVQVQNAYMALISGGTIDATNANVRNGFGTIFAGGTSSNTNLTNLAQRFGTIFELLFTTASVCSCFGQAVTTADVAQALGS